MSEKNGGNQRLSIKFILKVFRILMMTVSEISVALLIAWTI